MQAFGSLDHSMQAFCHWTIAQYRYWTTGQSLNEGIMPLDTPSIQALDNWTMHLIAGIWAIDELLSRAMAKRVVDQCRHSATDPRTVALYNVMPYIYII